MTSNCRRKKKNVNRLSFLPEDILAHIISLMRMKSAVQTSILSKRWRYNWVLTRNLEFDDHTFPHVHGKDHLLEFVDRVLALKLTKTSSVEFFNLKNFRWSIPKSALSKWIDEAVNKLNVSELHIQVRQLDLPLSLFTCKTLTKFRLNFFPLIPRYKPLWDYLSLVSLPCLKTLDIVVYSKQFNNAVKLINGCLVLENLSLEIRCRDSAENYYFKIPTLKRLTLSIHASISVINIVVLNVPNLEYLCINEDVLNSLFVMKDLSSLLEAKSSFGIKFEHLWIEILKGISGTRYPIFLYRVLVSIQLPISFIVAKLVKTSISMTSCSLLESN